MDIIPYYIQKLQELSWQDAALYIGIFLVFTVAVLINQLVGRDESNWRRHDDR